MKKTLLAAVSSIAVLAALPAWADCEADLRDYNEKISASDEQRAGMSARMRSDIRQLRDSARLLQQAGQEGACQEVVAAIKEMVENPKQASTGSPDYESWNTEEKERLKSAQSLGQLSGRMRAEEIIGSDVRNPENNDLGEIDDILLATAEGETSYAIISRGGFLGLGEKQIAVPLHTLKVTGDKDVFVLNVTEPQLENAPSFERGKFGDVADDAWRKKNNAYYEKLE